MTKQFDRDCTLKLFPTPLIGDPCGTTYLKFSNSSKINGNFVATPLSCDVTTSQVSSGLDRLIKSKKVRYEKDGLFKHQFIRAVAKEKGILFIDD